METKHTKGEWKHDSYSVWTESKTEFIEGNIICEAPEHAIKSMQNWKANAKLIASAPDLLHAAIFYIENFEKDDPQGMTGEAIYHNLKDAIKKATE